jgi:hypothetical protein
MSSYPGALKNFTDFVDGVDYPQATMFNQIHDEVEAIQAELGTDPAGASASTVKERLENIEATDWLLEGKKRRVAVHSVKADDANAPSESFLTGTNVKTNVMWFNKDTNQKVHFTFHVPPDCDPAEDLTLILGCVIPTAEASKAVVLDLDYRATAESEQINAGGSEQSDTAILDVGTWTANYLLRISSLAAAAAQIAAADTISFSLSRDTANGSDNYGYNFGIINIALEYTVKNPT